MIHRPSPNHGPRPAGSVIDMLVLHYTGMQDAEAALTRMCDPAAQVSAHYMIGEDGTVYTLVDESRRAWHAGLSFWRGGRDVNSRSIGVELVNPGHEFGYRPFPAVQMEALATLGQAILSRHSIPPRNVVGHSDVAPARKQDPGELFDWTWLAGRGIGIWPDGSQSQQPVPVADIGVLLARWGFDPEVSPNLATMAFQRHFRPARCDGIEDLDTVSRLLTLLKSAENASD